MKSKKVLLTIICAAAVLFALPLSVSAIGFNAEEKYNSVFVVTSGNSLGSGFAIGENCVVTNAHVLGNIRNINITTYSGESHTAFLIGIDEDKDIAVLGVRNVNFPYLKIDAYTDMNTGDDVYAIGAPKSMAYTLTKGVISAKEREIGKYTFIQTDAAINEGNSGGPLINDAGNVIGMNTLKMSDSEGIGLAIPMTAVSEFVKSLNIEIDDNGNISAVIESSFENYDISNEKGSKSSDTEAQDNETNKPAPIYIIMLLVALAISLGLNTVLVIMLIFEKRKKLNLEYDPTERTDFDIDILE